MSAKQQHCFIQQINSVCTSSCNQVNKMSAAICNSAAVPLTSTPLSSTTDRAKQTQLPPSCSSQIYCTGPLLHTVQMAQIFNDSKTFVDLKMKYSEEEILKEFNTLMEETDNHPTKDQIEKLVSDNFEDGNTLVKWNPEDFNPEPPFLGRINDEELRNWVKKVIGLWKELARKADPQVLEQPELYSFIYIPNGFIIPGGRFKEIYYWDTYWIVNGLLISGMKDTARGMIENLMYLVKKLGHVPNGSRVYYNERSQPPLLTKMVHQYIKSTNDLDWLKMNIDILEEELEYWIKNRQVSLKHNGIDYKVYHYNAPSAGPRPESYREDYITAHNTSTPDEIYIELKSGAESGWDFSSRWIFDLNGGNNANLTQINTRRVIPVDLNSFLYDAFNILSELYFKIDNETKSLKWEKEAIALKLAINKVLWNEDIGVWLDLDLKLLKHRNYFYVSNLTPLWVNCDITEHKVERVLQYLHEKEIDCYPGGTPTSLNHTGEQWDFPNAWPPLQAIIIQGLYQTNNKDARELATKLAENWINANMIGYEETNEMFEKYDANTPGQFGGGGEYTVQAGFGWTNGVALELINIFYTK